MFSSVGGQEPYSFLFTFFFFVCFVVSGKSSGQGYHNQKIKGNVGQDLTKTSGYVCASASRRLS